MREFKFDGIEYEGLEDFVARVDLSNYVVVDKDTGEELNPYEFFWKLFSENKD